MAETGCSPPRASSPPSFTLRPAPLTLFRSACLAQLLRRQAHLDAYRDVCGTRAKIAPCSCHASCSAVPTLLRHVATQPATSCLRQLTGPSAAATIAHYEKLAGLFNLAQKACPVLAPVGSVQASQAVQGPPTLEEPPPPLSTIHEDQNHQIGQKKKHGPLGCPDSQTEDPLSFLPRPDQGSQGSSKVRADRHGTWARYSGYFEL